MPSEKKYRDVAELRSPIDVCPRKSKKNGPTKEKLLKSEVAVLCKSL
jgi:hypothetical protein